MSFNRPVSQRIYGGSDIFLMPSHFEPCGLNQMIAMRYGCVPVVRSTGGLADTVADFRPETGQGNGFTFVDYDPMALYTSLVRAVYDYRHAETWNRLVRRCMAQDFSWGPSAGIATWISTGTPLDHFVTLRATVPSADATADHALRFVA